MIRRRIVVVIPKIVEGKADILVLGETGVDSKTGRSTLPQIHFPYRHVGIHSRFTRVLIGVNRSGVHVPFPTISCKQEGSRGSRANAILRTEIQVLYGGKR